MFARWLGFTLIFTYVVLRDNLNIIYKEKRSNKTFLFFEATKLDRWHGEVRYWRFAMQYSPYMISTLFVANDSWTSNIAHLVTCRFCIIMRQRAVRLHHIEVWWLPRQMQLINIIIVAKPKFTYNIFMFPCKSPSCGFVLSFGFCFLYFSCPTPMITCSC